MDSISKAYEELQERFQGLQNHYTKTRQIVIQVVTDMKQLQGTYDTLVTEYVQLKNERDYLREAIIIHRDLRGDDRCFLDDVKLYGALGEPVPDYHLPTRECFLKNCAAFYDRGAQQYSRLNRISQLTSRKELYQQALTLEEELELQDLIETHNADANASNQELSGGSNVG